MGFKTSCSTPPPAPAAQVCDRHIQAPVDDEKAALELARLSDVVRSSGACPGPGPREIESVKPLYPASSVIRPIQDACRKSSFLDRHGFPQTPYAASPRDRAARSREEDRSPAYSSAHHATTEGAVPAAKPR